MLYGKISERQNTKTGHKTRIKCVVGQHVVCMWAPSKEDDVREELENALKGNRFAVLAPESEEVYARQV